MSRRTVKVLVVAGLVTGFVGAAGATAWADDFTPAIEEPTAQLGVLRGAPILGGSPDGNSSSARAGLVNDYGYSSDEDGPGYSDSDQDPSDRYGYWRTGGGGGDSGDSYGRGGGEDGDGGGGDR